MKSIEASVKEHTCLELVRASGLFAMAKLLRDEVCNLFCFGAPYCLHFDVSQSN